MTEDELKQRFQTIEMRFRDIDTARAREREDQKREFGTMLTAARKTIEDTIARSEPLTQMREILSINKEQMAILGEARDERVRRSERDRVAAEDKEKAAAKKAADDKVAAEAATLRRERLDRYLKILGAVTALIVATGGAIGACSATTHALKTTTGAPTNGSEAPH